MTQLAGSQLPGHFQASLSPFTVLREKGLEGSKAGVLGGRKGGKSDPLIKREILLYLHCILLMRLDRADLSGQGQWQFATV